MQPGKSVSEQYSAKVFEGGRWNQVVTGAALGAASQVARLGKPTAARLSAAPRSILVADFLPTRSLSGLQCHFLVCDVMLVCNSVTCWGVGWDSPVAGGPDFSMLEPVLQRCSDSGSRVVEERV